MKNELKNKKITLATLKRFINKSDKLFVETLSSFSGMSDMVETVEERQMLPVEKEKAIGHEGVWIVGNSNDRFLYVEKEGYYGIEVSNSCGSEVLWTIDNENKEGEKSNEIKIEKTIAEELLKIEPNFEGLNKLNKLFNNELQKMFYCITLYNNEISLQGDITRESSKILNEIKGYWNLDIEDLWIRGQIGRLRISINFNNCLKDN